MTGTSRGLGFADGEETAGAAAVPAHGGRQAGRRLPGQHVACGWCGRPIPVRSRGRLPKWCSTTCRQRAWEQQRAADSGLSAVRVVDRLIPAVPADGPGWVEQLHVLAGQIAAGTRPIADADLTALTEALRMALAAAGERPSGRYRRRQDS